MTKAELIESFQDTTDRMEAQLAARDAEIARLGGELTQTKYQEQAYHNEANELRAEVERLRGACANACKVAIDASNVVHTLQADLTEARAVVPGDLPEEDLLSMYREHCECRPLDVNRDSHSHDCDLAYCAAVREILRRRVLAKSDGGK